MASGVVVNDEVVAVFNELKLGHKYKYCSFKLSSDLKEIVCDEVKEEGNWDDFLAFLPKDDCRYVCYSFDYVLKDGGKRDKVIMVSWCPETSKVKQKMVFASSKDALKKKLVGIANEIQADDISELAYDVVKEKVSRGGIA